MSSTHRMTLLAIAIGAVLVPATAQAGLSVSKKVTQNVQCSGGVCSATAAKAVLNAAELTNMLVVGDVKLVSGNQAMDISVDAPIGWTSTSRLTLDSYRSIAVNKPVTVTGTGAMTITTNDGGSGGDYRFFGKGHIEFWDLSSNLTINSQWYALVKGIRHIERQLRKRTFVAFSRSYNAAKDGVYAHSPIPSTGGIFEGLGNVISNLSILDMDSEDSRVGFFEEIGPGSVIRDVGLINVSVQGMHSAQAVGALLGGNAGGSVIACYATGKVTGSDASNVGGLVGATIGKTTDSHAAVAVNGGSDGAAGGLLGRNESPVKLSYATGGISGGDNSFVGGLIGQNDSAPTVNSFSVGAASGGSNSQIGGLVGATTGSDSSLQTSYSTGAVSGGTGSTIGGLIGSDTVPPGSIADTYWDFGTSGISNPHQGAGNVQDDPGITGLTDAQLKSGLPAGFDPTVWAINPKTNNGYPYLIANPPAK